MPGTIVSDPEKLLGKLGTKELLIGKYGFEIKELNLRFDNETTEDLALRSFKHSLVLENGGQALVLRKSKDVFIHDSRKAGLGIVANALNVILEVIEYNKSVNKFVVYIRTPCNHLNQRLPPMHAFNIVWGKYELDNHVRPFWDHRTESNQFSVNIDNTIAAFRKSDLVLGCNDKGELLLVKKDDVHRRLVFKDLFASLTWRLNYRLSTFRVKDLASLKKPGFMKNWMEPGTSERRMPGRLVSIEMMGRIIHEFMNFGAGNKLIAGDGYFASRMDRLSQHQVELIDRKDESADQAVLTFSSDMFEKCSILVNTRHKAIQYIPSQFFELSLDITWPENSMFDITKDKPQNSHFIHHVLVVDILNDADSAKDDPSLPVFFERVMLDTADVKYVNEYNQRSGTRFLPFGYFVKWIGKIEHAFDVKEGKMQADQPILLFWQHRGRNQIFCLEENEQTLHPIGHFDLAWGCCNTLKLVARGSSEMIKFADISTFLQTENKLDPTRKNEIAQMSRSTSEWDSPFVMAYGVFSAITEIAVNTK